MGTTAMTLVEEFDAGVQHRRHEAWQCRIAGYAACAVGALLIAVAVILSYAFGIPSTEPTLGWLVVPGIGVIMLGCFFVMGGVLEAY
jgi:hypothetical protein